ncbi:MAG: hypothetical protein FJ215_12730 [Ignavibacteria bacterium]|nr:hypothetical protein [Ignavibacteria bacterium]
MRYVRSELLLILLMLMMVIPASSQNLEETLQKLTESAAKSYVAPIVSGYGANINGGWFHRSPKASLIAFDLEFGVVAMGTFFSDEHKTFNAAGTFRFTSAQAQTLADRSNAPVQFRADVRNAILSQEFSVNFAGPTVAGAKKDSMKVSFPGKSMVVSTALGPQTYTLPSHVFVLPVTGLLEDATILPMAAPQATIGTVVGSQFTFRYLPEMEINAEIGKVKYVGWGVQHNPGVWLGEGKIPFELSASYFTQDLSVGTIFESSGTTFGLNASKQLGWGFLNLTPYVGYMIESSKMKFTYDYMIDTPAGKVPQKVNFELEGENTSRFTVGLSFKLLLVNVNADYNFGTYKSVTAGAMISF